MEEISTNLVQCWSHGRMISTNLVQCCSHGRNKYQPGTFLPWFNSTMVLISSMASTCKVGTNLVFLQCWSHGRNKYQPGTVLTTSFTMEDYKYQSTNLVQCCTSFMEEISTNLVQCWSQVGRNTRLVLTSMTTTLYQVGDYNTLPGWSHGRNKYQPGTVLKPTLEEISTNLVQCWSHGRNKYQPGTVLKPWKK